MGDATADIDGEDFDGTVYTVSDEAAAERLMTSYAHISLIADLAASRLSKQLGWGPEKYEQLLADCARRLSEQGEEESGL
jgi:predicted HicB family RNase H-like nuclease